MSSGSDKSSDSSVTNDDGVSSQDEEDKETKSRSVSFLSATARYRQMKFKVDFTCSPRPFSLSDLVLLRFLFGSVLSFFFSNPEAEQTIPINCMCFASLILLLNFCFDVDSWKISLLFVWI